MTLPAGRDRTVRGWWPARTVPARGRHDAEPCPRQRRAGARSCRSPAGRGPSPRTATQAASTSPWTTSRFRADAVSASAAGPRTGVSSMSRDQTTAGHSAVFRLSLLLQGGACGAAAGALSDAGRLRRRGVRTPAGSRRRVPGNGDPAAAPRVGGRLELPAGGQWVPDDGHYGMWWTEGKVLRRRWSRTRRSRARLCRPRRCGGVARPACPGAADLQAVTRLGW